MSRAAIALAAALSLTVGTAMVAHADSFRHRDPTGDVAVVATDEFGRTDFVVDPNQRRPDIQQLTVVHSRWALSIATTLRGLESAKGSRWAVTVRTSKGDRFLLNRIVSAGDGGVPEVTLRRNGFRFECDGVTVSRTSAGVIAKLPTRCLGNPWKARVGVQAFTNFRTMDPDGIDKTGEEDALTTHVIRINDPALTPWIAR